MDAEGVELPARKKIQEHFGECYNSPPLATRVHPTRGEVQIDRWLEHQEFDSCYVPVIMGEADYSHFYCSKCNSWKKISTSIGHIRVHYENERHSDDIFASRHMMSRGAADKLRRAIILFILENGLPFSFMSERHLTQCFRFLPGEREMRQLCLSLAKQIARIVKSELLRAEFVSISMDEWTDILRRRFLGISCHAFIEGQLRVFTLSHSSINVIIDEQGRDHVNSGDLAALVDQVLKDYRIGDKTLLLITDKAAIMPAAAASLNAHRIDSGQDAIMWSPCVCHAINLLMGQLVKQLTPDFRNVIKLASDLAASEAFYDHATRMRASLKRIATYTEVRWYSMWKMLSTLQKLKPVIISFYASEHREPVPEEIWGTIADFIDFVQVIKKTTKALEGENYSTICYVISGFATIKDAFLKAVEGKEKYADVRTKWLAYYDKNIGSVMKSWSPLLETSCYLHPGLDHRKLLKPEAMQSIMTFLFSGKSWADVSKVVGLRQLAEARQPRPMPQVAYTSHVATGERRDRNIRTPTDKPRNALLDLMEIAPSSVKVNASSITDEIAFYESHKRIGVLEPVTFWQQHSADLPRLSHIANRLMGIIPSSSATERMFSASKRIQGLRRSHMDEVVFEAAVMVVSNPEVTDLAYDEMVADAT